MAPPIKVITSFLASFGAGYFGYLFINSRALSWLAGLTMPALTPSQNTFAIVWLIIYGAMATALAIAWTKDPRPQHIEGWVRFFFVQLLFNAAFMMFFFGFQAVFISFMTLLILGFMVISLAATATEIDRRSAYLMIAYFLWILFNGYLVASIWLLN